AVMVGVAQLVEHRIVAPGVVGSIPIVHPIFSENARHCLAFLYLHQIGGRGGIGRHTRFRFWRREVCEFESLRPHHLIRFSPVVPRLQQTLPGLPEMWSLSGYFLLFSSALVAATLLPLQSELVLVSLLMAGPASVLALLVVATAGNVLGSLVNWWLGRYLLRWQLFPAVGLDAPCRRPADPGCRGHARAAVALPAAGDPGQGWALPAACRRDPALALAQPPAEQTGGSQALRGEMPGRGHELDEVSGALFFGEGRQGFLQCYFLIPVAGLRQRILLRG